MFFLIIIIATTSNSSIGLAFNVDVDFTFFLIESEIGEVHKEYAGNYKNVILSRAEEVSAYTIFVQVTMSTLYYLTLGVS